MDRKDEIASGPQEGFREQIHHDTPAHGHNASMQHGVDPNPDLALHYSHEHQHAHVHHGSTSLAHRVDDVEYSHGTTDKGRDLLDKPPQDYKTHQLRDEKSVDVAEIDAESGGLSPARVPSEEEPVKKRSFSKIYRKYKIVFHLAVWGLFLG